MSNCALYLIREWADVTATDKAGNTPLHHAASRGLYKVLSPTRLFRPVVCC